LISAQTGGQEEREEPDKRDPRYQSAFQREKQGLREKGSLQRKKSNIRERPGRGMDLGFYTEPGVYRQQMKTLRKEVRGGQEGDRVLKAALQRKGKKEVQE